MKSMRGWRLFAAAVVAILAGGLGSTAGAEEIDPANVRRGKSVWQEKGTCGFCHGWAGDGNGEPRSPGRAPSLRVTQLDRELLAEIIQCGRPGKVMPYHDAFAYTDKRCYDVSRADLGDQMPPQALQPLTKREIEWVVDYILVKLKGKDAVTLAECEEFFSKGSVACNDYK